MLPPEITRPEQINARVTRIGERDLLAPGLRGHVRVAVEMDDRGAGQVLLDRRPVVARVDHVRDPVGRADLQRLRARQVRRDRQIVILRRRLVVVHGHAHEGHARRILLARRGDLVVELRVQAVHPLVAPTDQIVAHAILSQIAPVLLETIAEIARVRTPRHQRVRLAQGRGQTHHAGLVRRTIALVRDRVRDRLAARGIDRIMQLVPITRHLIPRRTQTIDRVLDRSVTPTLRRIAIDLLIGDVEQVAVRAQTTGTGRAGPARAHARHRGQRRGHHTRRHQARDRRTRGRLQQPPRTTGLPGPTAARGRIKTHLIFSLLHFPWPRPDPCGHRDPEGPRLVSEKRSIARPARTTTPITKRDTPWSGRTTCHFSNRKTDKPQNRQTEIPKERILKYRNMRRYEKSRS